MDKIENVKVGDHVVCFDEYSHDYTEHELIVNSIEYNDEDGIVLYGTDLSFPEDEYEDYITRVNKLNFVCILARRDN